MLHLSFVSSINCRFYLLSFYVLSYTGCEYSFENTRQILARPNVYDYKYGAMYSKIQYLHLSVESQ